jgi:hypothetical protein|tara:strand:+ start:2503 stop:2697 length:195 start_codon:yes stop_codon:yes gene_type:complete
MSLYGIRKKLNKWWRIWAQSLGEKVGESDRQADFVAMIRTFWWTVHIVTCFFIIAGNSKMLGLW